ncbi:uncharacterized protein [Blastocystis hominis]|uniref:Uncharacterized protein n=1 Tax=Blastocystis hominis TaxID=12968 RepID=D8MBT4_BLAHO|nr:uncharacterized protein [Blastocystis hominis]CBK25523.2 unnamed protein product [Blastocystis hominis]|eukprot:XP_012899571.1 uncharacterized protein [Blastocystis hominis]
MGYSASSVTILTSCYDPGNSDLLCCLHFHPFKNQGVCAIFLHFLSSELHLSIPVSFTVKTILLAIFLGIVVPVVTVLPVIYQLFQEMERSVHSDGNQVIEYEIHTAKEKPLISYFITTICLMVVVCGTAIYYFLPLGFISNDMTIVFYVFMLILILFIVGLVLLVLPILHPFSRIIQYICGLFCSRGVCIYSRFSIRNNHKRIHSIQLAILFGYSLILFISTIAQSQTSLLFINLKYYYGSAISFSTSPADPNSVSSLVSQMERDPMLSSLTFDWISNPILNEDTSFPVLSSIGRVVERPARLFQLEYSLICSLAVSDELFTTLFSVWIGDNAAQLNQAISSSSLPNSPTISAIFPSNLKDVFYSDLDSSEFKLLKDDQQFSIRPLVSTRWLSPLISFSPPLTYVNDGPSPLLSSLSEFSKLSSNITVDSVYIKVPGQDESLPINEIERIVDYLASNYPSINVKTIISEYKVHSFRP